MPKIFKNDDFPNNIIYFILLIIVIILGCGIPITAKLMTRKDVNITLNEMQVVGHVSELLTGVWRQMIIFIFMLFPSIFIVIFKIKDRSNEEPQVLHKIFYFSMVSIGYSGWIYSVFASLQFTYLSHIMLFSNMHSILISIKKIVLRESNRYEIIGVIISMIGIILIFLEIELSQADTKHIHDIILGDAIAFCGSICAVLYLQFSTFFTESVIVLQCATNFIAVYIGLLLVTLIPSNTIATMDMNPVTGWFGWCNLIWVPYMIFTGVITGVIGATILIKSLKYVDTIVVSILYLSEPILTVMFGILFDVSELPDYLTIIGGIMILIGIGFTIFGSNEKSNSYSEL